MNDDLFHIIEGEAPSADGDAPSAATIVLDLYVQPGAGRSAVVSRRQNALHVRVAPPPADGRANTAVEVLIADLFDVPQNRVSVVAGHKHRNKRVQVAGVDVAHVRARLAEVTAAKAPGPAFNEGKVRPRK